MEGVSVGYEPGKPILTGLDLRLDDDDRIALLGVNGNGKSTFAKLVAGALQPETGSIVRASKLKIGFFAQHQLESLNPERSAYDHVRALMPDAPEAKVRARTAQIGLTTEKMGTVAANLSGGEKARLMMGLAAFGAPNLLILDEPTNHLDIDSREALVHALNDYSGAVVLITHDRHLIEACADRLWLVANGTVTPYDGDIEDYRRMVLGIAPSRRDADRCAGGKAAAAARFAEGCPSRGGTAPRSAGAAQEEDQRGRAPDRDAARRNRAPRQGAGGAGPLRERSGEGGGARQDARRPCARFRAGGIGVAGPLGGARGARGGGSGRVV